MGQKPRKNKKKDRIITIRSSYWAKGPIAKTRQLLSEQLVRPKKKNIFKKKKEKNIWPKGEKKERINQPKNQENG